MSNCKSRAGWTWQHLGVMTRGLSIAVLLTVCTSLAAGEPDPGGSTALATARRLVEAFNQHDPAAMASLVTADFELFYVSDEGKAELAIVGPQQLATEMESYFAQRATVRSEVMEVIDGPAFVAFREQIVGGASSLAVYEIRDGLVRRAWYYPAENEAPAAR